MPVSDSLCSNKRRSVQRRIKLKGSAPGKALDRAEVAACKDAFVGKLSVAVYVNALEPFTRGGCALARLSMKRESC